MANYLECPICYKRLTQHVPTLPCSTCNLNVHISCLPFYSDSDILTAHENNKHWICTKCLSNLFPFYCIEDTHDFLNTIQNVNLPNLLNIENMLFDPFNTNQDGGALDDLDPDDGYYNLQNIFNNNTCKYSYPDQLADKIKNWTLPPNISILHHNIRNTRQNYTELTSLLNSLNHSFSVLGLTETWLKPYNASLYSLDGYAHKYLTREKNNGGG